MRVKLFLAGLAVLATFLTARAEEQTRPHVQFILAQPTAADLQGRKVEKVEVTSKATASQEIAHVAGDQGEQPLPEGTYFPQAVMIVLEGGQRVQSSALFSSALPEGATLAKVAPIGSFTAETGMEVVRWAAFDGVMRR